MTRIILVALLAAACGDSKRKPPWPPLLGMQSKATLARFEAACDERFAPVDSYAENHGEPKQYAHLSTTHDNSMRESHYCEMSVNTSFRISFFLGVVSRISITAPTAAERLEVFDRAFAASLPDNIRDAMRRSILDPDHFEFVTQDGGVFVEPGSPITWRLATRDEVLMKPSFDHARAGHAPSTPGGSDDAH